MNILTICPCCTAPLLHHVGNHREYWFCRHCWSEMPNLEINRETKHPQLSKIVSLSTSFSKLNKAASVS